jgi:hypothetical protein
MDFSAVVSLVLLDATNFIFLAVFSFYPFDNNLKHQHNHYFDILILGVHE